MAEKNIPKNINEEIRSVRNLTEERIKEIKTRISSIDRQLIDIETIINDLQAKIESIDESKYTLKSRLIRWYLEDVKIYRELNEIRANYENILQKYIDQLYSSTFKIKDLELKYQKIKETDNNIRELFEEIDKKIKLITSDENDGIEDSIDELYDEKFSL